MTRKTTPNRLADDDVSRYRDAQWNGRPPCRWADMDNHERDIWREFFQCHLDDIASGRHNSSTASESEGER